MFHRSLFALFLALTALAAPLGAQSFPSNKTVAAVEQRECVVFITRTGSRYHVDGCQYLRRSRIPVTKRDAEARGHTPCLVCGGSRC